MISATASKNINLMTKLRKVGKITLLRLTKYILLSESSKGDEDEDVDEDKDDSVIYAYQDRRKMKK